MRHALLEDLGAYGDRTSQAVLSDSTETRGRLVARAAGVLCGVDVARLAFELINHNLRWQNTKNDGDRLAAGETFATIEGNAIDILSAERVAVNFLTRMCGIASTTAEMVERAGGVSIYCTRKTTPNLRLFEKYAVACGGGGNHRFGLSDGVLIKDNHLALAPSISEAVRRARAAVSPLTKIEVETDSIDALEEIIGAGADAVLLDNMSPQELTEAVRLIDGRIICEASGNIGLDNVAAFAASGVDIISSGALTHSVRGLDIGLDLD